MLDPKILNVKKTMSLLEDNNLAVDELEAWVQKFKNLRQNARGRGVMCSLRLSQYVRLAIRAGIHHPSQIGKKSLQYHMARIGDIGDYAWGNCRFLTAYDNIAERAHNGGRPKGSKDKVTRTSSKRFVLTAPSGEKHRGVNLKTFAKEHDLNQGAMSLVCSGKANHHKGWTGRYLTG